MTPAAGNPLVTVAVINYEGAHFLVPLLESLAAQSFRDFALVVLDNASRDDSLAVVRRVAPAAEIVAQPSNLGFARAANLALSRGRGRYLALLNPDIELDADWLETLVEAAERDPDAAAVAGKLFLYEQPTVLNGVGGCMNRLGYSWDRGYGETDRGQFDAPAEVLFASAGAGLFRRQPCLEAGGFDERFFMYHEDVDLGWRLWLLGHRVVTAPGACARHHFGGTTRKVRSLSWRERLGERHNIRSLIKNYEANTLRRVLLELLLLRQPPARKLAQLNNFAWNGWWLADSLSRRRRIQKQRSRTDRDLEGLIVQSPDVPVRL